MEIALGALRFVRSGPDGAAHVALSAGRIALIADDGTMLSNTLGEASDPAFGQRLEAELQKVARVAQLFALRTQPAPDAPAAVSVITPVLLIW